MAVVADAGDRMIVLGAHDSMMPFMSTPTPFGPVLNAHGVVLGQKGRAKGFGTTPY